MKGVATFQTNSPGKLGNLDKKIRDIKIRLFLKIITTEEGKSEFEKLGHSKQGAAKAVEVIHGYSKKYIQQFFSDYEDEVYRIRKKYDRW